jgi:hypothetical protein
MLQGIGQVMSSIYLQPGSILNPEITAPVYDDLIHGQNKHRTRERFQSIGEIMMIPVSLQPTSAW